LIQVDKDRFFDFMKNLLPLFFLSFYLINTQAQSICVPDDDRLDVNELSTVVNPLYLWWDGSEAQFNYPNGVPINAVFAGGLWLTAQYPNGDQYSSVTEYGAASDRFDFQTGPVGTGGSFTSSSYFCRSFKVTQQQITDHLDDLTDGSLDQPIAAIMEWPGRDNALMPTTAFGRELAPFIDTNGDGVYQPEMGDYPKIKADEAVWWVTNDFGPHNESLGDGIGTEVQVLAQAFEAPNHPAAKAQLYSVKVINTADVTLDSLALSLWVDPDVGCYTDDAVGSLPSRNAVFAYNIDAVDGTVGAICEQGISTYADNPPMIFFQTLNSSLNGDVASVRNSGISLNNVSVSGMPTTYDPTTTAEYFNVSHARWLDGAPLTFGDNGVGGTQPTNWIYSGNPANSTDWSQCQNYMAQDRRLLLNVNLQESFEVGAEFTVDFLVSIVTDIPLPCPDIDLAIPVLDSIANFVELAVITENQIPPASFKELTIQPNPSRGAFSIHSGNDLTLLENATLYDGLGRVVEQYDSAALMRLIDVAHLPRGVYLLVAEDAKGEQYLSRAVLE